MIAHIRTHIQTLIFFFVTVILFKNNVIICSIILIFSLNYSVKINYELKKKSSREK